MNYKTNYGILILITIGITLIVLSSACITPGEILDSVFGVKRTTTTTIKTLTTTTLQTTTTMDITIEQECSNSSCCGKFYGYCYTHCGKENESECKTEESKKSGCISLSEGSNCLYNLTGICYNNCEKNDLLEAAEGSGLKGLLNCCIRISSVCDKMKDDDRDNCYYEFALERENFDLCNEIKSNLIKTICLAVKDKRKEICALISDVIQKDKCFLGIAIVKRDERICEGITRNDIRDKCYYDLARKKDDYSLCYKIMDLTLRNLCSKCSLRLHEIDKEGIVDSNSDMVWLEAIAENCKNLHLYSYGDSRYLNYYSKSDYKIRSNNKSVWIKYKCHESGEKIVLKMMVGNSEIKEYVKCNPKPKLKCSLEIDSTKSDLNGTARSDNDTLKIVARAKNCKYQNFNFYTGSKYIEFLDKSGSYISRDDQGIWVEYKCLYSDPEIPVEITIGRVSTTVDVKCNPGHG